LCLHILDWIRHVASYSEDVEHPCEDVCHQQFVPQKFFQARLEVCNSLLVKCWTVQYCLICKVFGFLEHGGLPQKLSLVLNRFMYKLWAVNIISSLWTCLILPLVLLFNIEIRWLICLNVGTYLSVHRHVTLITTQTCTH
jgi:hypothetical protein